MSLGLVYGVMFVSIFIMSILFLRNIYAIAAYILFSKNRGSQLTAHFHLRRGMTARALRRNAIKSY